MIFVRQACFAAREGLRRARRDSGGGNVRLILRVRPGGRGLEGVHGVSALRSRERCEIVMTLALGLLVGEGMYLGTTPRRARQLSFSTTGGAEVEARRTVRSRLLGTVGWEEWGDSIFCQGVREPLA